MGIQTKTVTECTCDVCGNGCQQEDAKLRVQINGGDRDIGPSTIYATVTVDHPYRCNKGIVCKKCQKKWLQEYVNGIDD
jgi:hypothetical protein